jgi:hypothetical protein
MVSIRKWKPSPCSRWGTTKSFGTMGLEYMKDALPRSTDTHSMIGLLDRDWRKTTLLTSLALCFGGDHARLYWHLAGDRSAIYRLQLFSRCRAYVVSKFLRMLLLVAK